MVRRPSYSSMASALVVALLVLGCTRTGGPPTTPVTADETHAPTASPAPSTSAAATAHETPSQHTDSVTMNVWFAALMDDWVVVDPVADAAWQLPTREVPVDVRDRQLLTVSFDDARSASTIRIRDLDSEAAELLHYEAPTPVNRASFLADRVLFAPSPEDTGVWSIALGEAEPTRITAPSNTKADPAYGRTSMLASSSHRSVVSQIAVEGGGNVADVITSEGVAPVALPGQLSAVAITDDVIVAMAEERLVGVGTTESTLRWEVPFGGILQGLYPTSDGTRIIVARFDPEGSGDLQLIAVDGSSGKVSTIAAWPAGEGQPSFWQPVSTDQTAVFSSQPLDSWIGSPESAAVTIVDLSDGHMSAATVEAVSAEPIR